MKRISLKNVNFSEALSEETNAFVADVYLDNVKFGYAKNTGHGGCTDVTIGTYKNDAGRIKMKELFVEAEAYCKSLPELDYGTFKMDSNLEVVVDTLFEEWLELKELKKHMTKAIVFKDKDGEVKKLQYKLSIAKLIKHPRGIEVLTKQVDKLKKEGATILNTNLTGVMV